MKPYWDTSALVEAIGNLALRRRVHEERPYTRAHSLAEAFSVLTGGRLGIRLDAKDAAAALENLSQDLEFVDLTGKEVVAALKTARSRGVRGGKIHDFIHAKTAEHQKATMIVTLDQDFALLTALKIDLL